MQALQKWIQAYRHFRVGGKEASRRFLRECDHGHAHVLSITPPVVYLWWGRDDSALHEELSRQSLVILYLFPWCYSREELPALTKDVGRRLQRYPKHRIIFLCNEAYAVDDLRGLQIEAEFINQNAFINENVFQPRPSIARTHDALYSASLAPYKRHALATEVRSLIMLSYTYGGTSNDEYSASVREVLSHAWWAKDSLHAGQKFTTDQIVDLYARASTGLCLSAIEGGMFVSMEYLLCGLSIVTTPSIGGRSTFWDDRYVIVCEDNPGAVADAVQEAKRRNVAPADIRRWTLEKIEPHRERLRRLLHSLGAEATIPWTPGSHGISTFTNLRTLGRNLRENRSLDYAK